MAILIGLAVATVLVIGCYYGNIFVCVFLTLSVWVIALVGASDAPNGGAGLAWIAVGAILTCGIWAPCGYRRGWFKQASVSRPEGIGGDTSAQYIRDITEPLRLEIAPHIPHETPRNV